MSPSTCKCTRVAVCAGLSPVSCREQTSELSSFPACAGQGAASKRVGRAVQLQVSFQGFGKPEMALGLASLWAQAPALHMLQRSVSTF